MTLPSTMRAVTPRRAGGPEVLQVETLPVPGASAGQVLIRVAWAGINPHDFGQRGRGAPPPGQTPVLGLECAGEIVAVGQEVPAARIGEKVCALVPGGGYADYCLADAQLALPQPPALSEQEAGALNRKWGQPPFSRHAVSPWSQRSEKMVAVPIYGCPHLRHLRHLSPALN